jgi:site-specific DNA recombinase
VTGDHWGCSRFRNGGQACDNNRMIVSHLFQARVLADLKAGMLAPDVVAAYVREYHRDFARKSADLGRDRAKLEQRRAEADRRTKRLMEAFVGGGSEFAEVREALTAARDERDRLGRELASLNALPTVLTLHPRLEEEYRRQVAALEASLMEPEAALEAVPRLRAMIARIIVRPAVAKRGVDLTVIRQIDEVLNLVTAPTPLTG